MDCCTAIYLASQEEAYFAPFIQQGRNVQQIPEWIAIFPVVQKQLDRLLAFTNRCSQPASSVPVCQITLKETTVSWYNILARVPGHRNEAV